MKNLGVDIIYILNRKKDFERKEAVLKELSNLEGLNYQIITSVTGDSLDTIPDLIEDKKLFPIFTDPRGIITKNIIATAFTHNKAVNRFLESDYETNTEYVVTKIICPATGKSLESRKKLSTQSDPQKLGSEITYYRRYTLQSLLALQAEDDDGNKAVSADNEKIWLNQNTPQFTEAINFIKGGGSLEQIKTKYKISKKVQDELTRL